MIAGEHFAVEDGVGRDGAGTGHAPTHLHRLIQRQGAILKRVGVGPADQGGAGVNAISISIISIISIISTGGAVPINRFRRG